MKRTLFWFRQDLRLLDNPALRKATEEGLVLFVYIMDTCNSGEDATGEASRFWLHKSLHSLNDSLQGKLHLYKGDPCFILQTLCIQYDIDTVRWNRCYEPWSMQRDTVVKKNLQSQGISVISDNASLLWEPWKILKPDETSYQVFTPFYKRCLLEPMPREPIASPSCIKFITDGDIINNIEPKDHKVSLEMLGLLPRIPWYKSLESTWPHISEQGARSQLEDFLSEGLRGYKKGRDFPALQHVSRLSPFLHYGQISPHQLWHAQAPNVPAEDREYFLRELVWREFSYHILYHHQNMRTHSIQKKFEQFPWITHEEHFIAWTKGNTGIPLVDAGMRELWQTGYMHNRVRMVVASFLVKNLLIDWRKGEKWFWNCLVDADMANNSASWQWVAGCGMDAAPYFRIFNPVTQAEKFDPNGTYITRYIPALSQLPATYVGCPWLAPASVREAAGVILGKTYPYPLVDLHASRTRALEAYKSLT